MKFFVVRTIILLRTYSYSVFSLTSVVCSFTDFSLFSLNLLIIFDIEADIVYKKCVLEKI